MKIGRLAPVLAVLLVAGCAAHSTSTQAGKAAGTAGTAVVKGTTLPKWIVTGSALGLLRGGMTSQQLTTLFDNPNTYLLGPAVPGFGAASRTQSTPTIATGVPSGASALLYDVEDWPLTPAAQQHDPAKYEALNHAFAQAHHLTFIATPATDLVRVLDPNGTGTVQDRYLKLGIIADAARNADVVDIQAQGLENGTGFADFVTKAAAQARAANPKVIVLAGLSTNPSGHAVDPAVFARNADAVRGVVDGYWLNIPAAGQACPDCGTPHPEVAYPWLRSLLGS